MIVKQLLIDGTIAGCALDGAEGPQWMEAWINRRMELVFTSHSFDVRASWSLEGSKLEECRLINCRNPKAILDVHIEILAAVGEDDGVSRWID